MFLALALAASAMQKSVCTDCVREVVVVVDHASGDTICTQCGLVLEERYIDDTSEWRTFDDAGDNDPVRVGGPTNPLLTSGGLSTIISKGNCSKDADFAALDKFQNRGNNPDRTLLAAFNKVDTMAERLGLVATIKDRANEIYKKVEEKKSLRGRSQNALVAACLYIACKQEGKPRTFKEIASVADGATKKEVGRNTTFIQKLLDEAGPKSSVQPGDFLRRFCSHLGMNQQAIRAATEAVAEVEALDIRKSPISIAAATIYMISLVSDKKPLKEISTVAGVAEATIKSTFSCLRPHATRLVPDWFCKPDSVQVLCK